LLEIMEARYSLIEWISQHAERNGFYLNPCWKILDPLLDKLIENILNYGYPYRSYGKRSGNLEEDRLYISLPMIQG